MHGIFLDDDHWTNEIPENFEDVELLTYDNKDKTKIKKDEVEI